MHRIKVNELHFPQADTTDFHFHYHKMNTCPKECDICRSEIPYIQFYEWQDSRSIINYNVFSFELATEINGKSIDKEQDIYITKMQDTIENSEFWKIPKRTFICFDKEDKIMLR
tara:strand:- start:394 stop:735 length:342 start_codon:yes stop_codon:yes gene_type:complete